MNCSRVSTGTTRLIAYSPANSTSNANPLSTNSLPEPQRNNTRQGPGENVRTSRLPFLPPATTFQEAQPEPAPIRSSQARTEGGFAPLLHCRNIPDARPVSNGLFRDCWCVSQACGKLLERHSR